MKISVIVLIASFISYFTMPKEFYVVEIGKDTNLGTKEKTVSTLDQAKIVVQNFI